MAEEKLPVVVIACKVFQDLLQRHLPEGLAEEVVFLEYGLHRVPRNLKEALQEQIEGIETPSLVVLGYGLCGNGLHGIRAGKHALLVPRVDDCIAVLLGSYEAYRREFESAPGTYYLSKGWLESGSNPLQEYTEYEAKYGPDQAKWLMDMQYSNYKRLVMVAHQQADLDQYRPQALQVAEYCAQWGMRYEEIQGSDRYLKRLVEVAASLEAADGEFVVVPPGGELSQSQFIRL